MQNSTLPILPVCFTQPTPINIGIASFIILGTIISYIPQYYNIIKQKSSKGINYLMIGISLFSAFLTCINSGILNWYEITCCMEDTINFGMCLENNLADLQLINGLICTFILYILVLVYFEEDKSEVSLRAFNKIKRWGLLFIVLIISGFLSISAAILYYELQIDSNIITTYAMVLGAISSILMVFQWVPQIYTTFKLKNQGSLSILMLSIQLPGAILVIIFQGFLNRANITTWLPYICNAFFMFVLILICIYYKFAKKDKIVNENSSLLHD